MPRHFGTFREDPPAVVADARDLFSWAKEEADTIAATLVLLNDKKLKLATIEAVVEESGEFGEVEEAKERLAKAKAAALDCDEVLKVKKQLKLARAALKRVAAVGTMKSIAGEVKVLRAVFEEGKTRLATGLADGKAPQVVPA